MAAVVILGATGPTAIHSRIFYAGKHSGADGSLGAANLQRAFADPVFEKVAANEWPYNISDPRPSSSGWPYLPRAEHTHSFNRAAT